ncbi:MAG: hypothetical protein R3B72_48005 [Polyangiaceae bacterium]
MIARRLNPRALFLAASLASCSPPPTTPTPPPAPSPALSNPPPPPPARAATPLPPLRPASEYLDAPDPEQRSIAVPRTACPLYGDFPGEGSQPLNPDVDFEGLAGSPLAVLEEHPDSLRILLDEYRFRLVAFVRKRDLRLLVDELALAREGLWIQPGVWVTEASPPRYAVQIEHPFPLRETVPEAAVGHHYHPPKVEHGPGRRVLLPSTEVRTASGALVVTIPEPGLTVTAEIQGDRARVRYAGRQIVFEGWVPRDRLGAEVGVGGSGRLSRAHRAHVGPRVDLPRGTGLAAAPGGELILRMKRRSNAQEGPVLGDGRVLRFVTDGWGTLSFWASQDQLERIRSRQAAEEARVVLSPAPGATALPWDVQRRASDIRECWHHAVDEVGQRTPMDLVITLQRGKVQLPELRTPGSDVDPALRACLLDVFDDLDLEGARVILHLALDPTPLP